MQRDRTLTIKLFKPVLVVSLRLILIIFHSPPADNLILLKGLNKKYKFGKKIYNICFNLAQFGRVFNH